MSDNKIAIRDAFFDSLYDIAKKDKRVIMVTADCGAPSLDKFRQHLKNQYFTVGIAEQNMINVAAGLALAGKIVYVYAIAPFASLRCYEQTKVNLVCMNLPVTILGIGAGFAYDIMGPTHHTTEDVSVMRALPNMTVLNPSDSIMAALMPKLTYKLPGPKYVRFDRGGIPYLYENKNIDLSDGLIGVNGGTDISIIATGYMVHSAIQLSKELAKHQIKAGVIDLFRIKPLNEKLLLGIIERSKKIVTLEEHFLTGGIGSAIAELMVDNETVKPLLRLGVCDRYFFEYGGREVLHCLNSLDPASLKKRIMDWLVSRKKVPVNV